MTKTQAATPAHPLRAALSLAGLAAAATLAAALLINGFAPNQEPMQQRLIAVLALAGFACVVVAATSKELFTSGRVRPVLLVVPALVILAPFAAGSKDLGLKASAMLVLGYLATSIYEELWFRGLVLKNLASWTPVKAAWLSSVLFGIMHLTNMAFGANPAITAAQVVGAACFGMGMAALRLRGVSLWVLIMLHAVGDIALQMGDVSNIWRWTLMVCGDVALLIYGLLILRTSRFSPASTARAADSSTAAA